MRSEIEIMRNAIQAAIAANMADRKVLEWLADYLETAARQIRNHLERTFK